jgi:seryl-tRNA synthetase
MLQVNYIKANREEVLSRLAKKNFLDSSLVDKIISHDDENFNMNLMKYRRK